MKKLNIGIIGTKFMGRAHSNAWIKAPLFFDLVSQPYLMAACGRDKASLQKFAEKWGWQEVETDWRKVVANPEIDIIDIAVPQAMHCEIAIAAARNGKHIFCEKPMAMNSGEAMEMLKVCEENKVKHYLNHNYRRLPAVALAKRLIEENYVGRIFHWRCSYQQDWIVSPDFPLTWQLRKETAQAGPQWDLNSHAVDLAHYLVGKINTVSALTANFIKERPLAKESTSGNLSAEALQDKKGKVTVEDAALMMVEFDNGAVGSFEASRFSSGRKNKLSFEIYGSSGSIVFDLERMNELQCYSLNDAEGSRGFKTILATDGSHPYMDHWWPPGHIIGYEHSFVHAVVDFVKAIDENQSIKPDFTDGLSIINVLEAGLRAAETGKKIELK